MTRYWNALVAAIMLVIALGAAVTSGHPGFSGAHRIAGVALGVLMLPLVRIGGAGRMLLAVIALEFVPAGPVFHACAAPLSLAAIAFLKTEPIAFTGARDGIDGLAKALPALVLLQIAMGAAYRHKIWGVMPHMGGAMIVATSALILSVLLLQRRPVFRKPAIEIMSIVLTQISLGIGSFVFRLLEIDTGIWYTVVTIAHVTTGAATLAASVRLARRMSVMRAPSWFALAARGE